MATQPSTSRSTRVSLSITEDRLAWLDSYAAAKKWPRSVLIGELIDGFRARLAANTPIIATQTPTDICTEGQHQREVRNGGVVGCKRCPAIKVNGTWSA